MLIKKPNQLLLAVLIFFSACDKNPTGESVVFETVSNDQVWVASGIMAGGRQVDFVIVDVPQLISLSYSYLTVEEKFTGSDWVEMPTMDLALAVSSGNDKNIYIEDASRGRSIRVYNFRRRAGVVSIRVRAHRRR